MKKLTMLLISMLLVTGLAVNAGAWEVVLSDAYSVESGGTDYWVYDINFYCDATDNLNNINLSVGFDTDDVEFVIPYYYEYDDGGFPVATDTWVGNMVSYNDTRVEGLVYDIQGQEPLGTSELFYPGATGQTLLFSLYFTGVEGGNFDDTSVYFTYGSDLNDFPVEAVNINGEINNNHDLYITADTITLAPVPVPGAVLLLGSGLIGLVGLRRRNN